MDDFKKIKKEYGEKMAQLCRELFPGFYETPGLMYELLSSTFYPSRFLYDDVSTNSLRQGSFVNTIITEYKKRYPTESEENDEVTKTPKELLEEAGYILYECKTEADIQSFRHYYKRFTGEELPPYVEGTRPIPYAGEELCTFNGDRLERCHVFFAVKKNVDEIKREDFKNPDREDEYGTSVISIQFSKGSNNVLSIKNRYNHTVSNPDATFSNNLDNIVPGLTKSFEETYGLKITHSSNERTIELPNYVKARDGRYYRYNYEIGNVYYCPDNIIIDNFEVKHFDKSRYLVMDYFIIDFQEKKIFQYAPIYNYGIESPYDSFVDMRQGGIKVSSIKVETDEETKDKKITINDNTVITLYPTNEIKSFKNDKLIKISDQFLIYVRNIKNFDTPNVTKIGNKALMSAKNLVELNLPNVEEIGSGFLQLNKTLQVLDLPKLISIEDNVLHSNVSLHTLKLPNCKKIGGYFLTDNEDLSEVDLPNCEEIGFGFLQNNQIIKRVNLPKCRRVDSDFLHFNTELEEIDMPNLEESGGGFLTCNEKIHKVNLPKLRVTYYNFMSKNKALESIELPSMVEVGPYFLQMNRILKHISLPNCAIVDDGFLCKNTMLEEIDLPEVVEIGEGFLESNVKLSRITIPKCKKIGDDFLRVNTNLEEIDLPEVQTIDKCFLMWNEILKRITIPKCKKIESDFLLSNTKLDEINISSIEEFCGKLVTPDNPIEQGEYGFLGSNYDIKLKRNNQK